MMSPENRFTLFGIMLWSRRVAGRQIVFRGRVRTTASPVDQWSNHALRLEPDDFGSGRSEI
jgi:hypothetical protein